MGYGPRPLAFNPEAAGEGSVTSLRESLAAELSMLEEKRLEAVGRRDFWLKWGGGLLLLYYGALAFMAVGGTLDGFFQGWKTDDLVTCALLATLLPAVFVAWLWYRPVVAYHRHYKRVVMPAVFQAMGLAYEPEGDIRIGRLKASGILPDYDREKTEDYFRGAYKGVTVEGCEAHLEERHVTTDSKGRRRTRYVTVFKGLFVLLEMNKDFNGKTIIVRDKGGVGRWLSQAFGSLEHVALEDVTFEEDFDVFSTDQIEARYLLTTAFMERLRKISEIFGGAPIQAGFYNERLLLMIPLPGHDLFQPPGLGEGAMEMEAIKTVKAEIDLVFSIIDTLKLDQRTGM